MVENKIDPGEGEDYYNTLSEDDEANFPVSPLVKSNQNKKNHISKKNFRILVAIMVAIILIFFTPFRINILLLGIDPTYSDTAQGRSDTMILTTVPPLSPYMHMLSIPRDLYVDIPGHGKNRINTAHFFAEVAHAGAGPAAAAQAVQLNFHLQVPYTVRIQIDGFTRVVDAMGGVTVYLPTDMSGLNAGYNTLDSTQTLRLVRDREGSDDFYRQMRAQIFIKAAVQKMLNPLNWWRIPGVVTAIAQSIDTNIPVFLWPRLGYSLLFSAVKGFDMHSLDRTMVTNWVTPDGAQVLLPVWEKIDPLLDNLFH
jgi:LCP family protein required for cell wall assembly